MNRLLLIAAAIGISGAGCSGEEAMPVTVMDYPRLVDGLRAAGATVEPRGELSQPFFSVQGRVLAVKGEDVQVFEYSNPSSAEAEAARVSRDGRTIGTTHVGWLATPRFYKAGRLIVIYVGENAAVASVLAAVLGAPFAGG